MARLNEVNASGVSNTKAAKPTKINGRLDDVFGNVGHVKTHVKPAVAEQVNHHVKVDKQAQHAPKTRQRRRFADNSQAA